MVAFMKVLIPVYCGAISFTLNFNASAATYSIIFAAIYLVEWMMRYLLVPFVKIYVILEFLNHLMEEERFKRLAELIASAVRVLLKIAVSFVLGMNIIQGMIAPAMDKLAENTIAKTMQMIPGIGNVMSGMGQIFLTSGVKTLKLDTPLVPKTRINWAFVLLHIAIIYILKLCLDEEIIPRCRFPCSRGYLTKCIN